MIREGDIGEKLFPDFPDMKVDFAEIGIGKIGISDYFNLKYRFLANFGKIGNNNFPGISYFLPKIRYSYRNIRSYPS